MWPKFGNCSICIKEFIITSEKPFFLRGALGSSSIIWGLAHVFALKFYTSVAKPLRLKVRKVLELSPTLVEVTGKKLVEESWVVRACPPPILNSANYVNLLSIIRWYCDLDMLKVYSFIIKSNLRTLLDIWDLSSYSLKMFML